MASAFKCVYLTIVLNLCITEFNLYVKLLHNINVEFCDLRYI